MSGYENRGNRRGRFHRGGGGGGRGRGGYRGGNGNGGSAGGGGGYFDRPYNKRPTSLKYFSHHQKRTRFEVTERLKEVDIGVTEFVGKHEHFSGILKERFNDFQVHEISMEGEKSELTNQDIPPEPEQVFNLDELKKNLPQETIDKIESLSNPDGDVTHVEIDVTDLNKEDRKVLHTLGKLLPSILSQTVDKDNKKVLVLMKGHNKKPYTKFYKDKRTEWNFKHNYCHFVLHKMNMDTMDALNQMAMYMHVKPNSFSYSGTKDRRARTTQWVCLKRIHPTKILEAGKRVPGAFVGNFKFANEPLRLGQLQGNHFTIVLRHVTATDEEIEAAVTSLRDNGFINYYGLQRFGTVAAVPTHHIGKALMQGNWQEAIDLIMKPRNGEYYDLAEARKIYAETRDAEAALKKLKHHDKLEARMLRGLCSCGPNNLQGALDFLPRNARTMYIHAYQSFVWNSMVSRRIREFGFKPVVGDLVYEQPDTNELDSIEETMHHDDSDDKLEDGKVNGHSGDEAGEKAELNGHAENETEEKVEVNGHSENDTEEKVQVNGHAENETGEKADDVKVNGHADEKMVEEKSETNAGEKSEDKMDEDPAPKADGEKAEEKKKKSKKIPKPEYRIDDPVEKDYHPVPPVKVLTEEDLPNYTIADVVMPQPGWRIVYPTYAKEWYEKFLAEDGLTTDLRRKNKKYSLGGQYRKIVQIPKNVSWKVVKYSDLKADLISADIEKLRKQDVSKIDPEGKHKALILEMTLASSSYATMALRELLKHDTSPEIQAAQSAAHHAKDEEERMQEAEEAKQAEEARVEEEKKANGTTAMDSAEVENVKMEADEENVKKEAEEENVKMEADEENVKMEAEADNAKMEIAEEAPEQANGAPAEPEAAVATN